MTRAPSGLGIRDARGGPPHHPLEIQTPPWSRGVSHVVDRVVLGELPPQTIRDHAKHTEVHVAHDRSSASQGNGRATAAGRATTARFTTGPWFVAAATVNASLLLCRGCRPESEKS